MSYVKNLSTQFKKNITEKFLWNQSQMKNAEENLWLCGSVNNSYLVKKGQRKKVKVSRKLIIKGIIRMSSSKVRKKKQD